MSIDQAVQAADEWLLAATRPLPAWLVTVLWILTVVGNGWGLLVVAPLVLRRSTRRDALWLLACQAVVSVAVGVIKLAVGRVRPCDALSWCPSLMIRSPGGESFPSGHAAGAFAFAAYLSTLDARFAWATVPIALAIASSRCVLGVHYPSDVLAGALLGSALGHALAQLQRRLGLRCMRPSGPQSRP